MPKRATLQETLEFANKVREAGGGNALKALMPSDPGIADSCLIANALNFQCTVSGTTHGPNKNAWSMMLKGRNAVATGESIASALNLQIYMSNRSDIYGRVEIILPEEIAQVARDFDKAEAILSQQTLTKSTSHRLLAIEMWDYIEADVRSDYRWKVEGDKLVANPNYHDNGWF